LSDGNRSWNHEFCLGTSDDIISSYELVSLQYYAMNYQEYSLLMSIVMIIFKFIRGV
jgi:hypothetical protein